MLKEDRKYLAETMANYAKKVPNTIAIVKCARLVEELLRDYNAAYDILYRIRKAKYEGPIKYECRFCRVSAKDIIYDIGHEENCMMKKIVWLLENE